MTRKTRLSKAQQEAIRTMLAATGTVAIPERTLRPIVQAGIRLGRNADGATIWKSPENLKVARFAADTGLVWAWTMGRNAADTGLV